MLIRKTFGGVDITEMRLRYFNSVLLIDRIADDWI
jgi:hypothetical protein